LRGPRDASIEALRRIIGFSSLKTFKPPRCPQITGRRVSTQSGSSDRRKLDDLSIVLARVN
jgi:hypothetical protein